MIGNRPQQADPGHRDRGVPHHLMGLIDELQACGGVLHIAKSGEMQGIQGTHTGAQVLHGQAVDYLRLVAWGIMECVETPDGTVLRLKNGS